MSDAYHRFAQRKALEFDQLERERRDFDEFNRRHGLVKDPEPPPPEITTAKEKRIRESAELNEWFSRRFEQGLLEQIEETGLLHRLFAMVIHLAREERKEEIAKLRKDLQPSEDDKVLDWPRKRDAAA